ncbi:uncharacterized protein LOC115428381 isoform X3 [Sphaeramia orbicularis]|uniref:uncharacterized protein LOC115428381 isoform X3 n=1 Tax=Sphaeramia orbicularis TaxID=375764 RepID=UPI00117FB722|nr:uncharacterized protein LOC115428381 isoform X3 [Sphaeramia orbicularis]
MSTRTFGCQVCLTTYKKVFDFKKHVSSSEHRKNMKTMFPEEKPFNGKGLLPSIVFLDCTATFRLPIIGLSQLTICYTPGKKICFYLCHVCEEKCSPDRIKSHFYHGDHYSSYFSYTNPDSLNFAWIPSASVTRPLMVCIKNEVDKNGAGVLQILDLPENLLIKAQKGTYSEVMHLFSENENLSKNIAVAIPSRKTIQSYLRSDTRQHPLLGMQHIVECICAGQKWKSHYLCTLCRLTLTTSMIVKHVLSFDHIYSYFEAWHPSTLMAKQCYMDNSQSFSSLMLDLAHQSQNILGTANSDIKQVILEPDVFTSVKLACYDKALKELESITKNETEHSLITSIKPGNKLEPSRPKLHSSVIGSMDTISAPKSTSTNPPNKAKQEKSLEKQKGESVSTECGSEQPFYVLRCQDCNMIFQEESHYRTHTVKMKHLKMVKRIFKVDAMPGQARFCKTPALYAFVKDTLENKLPVIGASLIVTVLCTKASDEPLCICFACEDCFVEKSLRQHMASSVHLIKTLMYQNPWRLPFAWDQWEGVNLLKTMAYEEEKERGRSERMVKVLDVPQALLRNLIRPCYYPSVMSKLVLYHAVLKRSVPPRETHRKLDQNDRFPLLGMQFLVKYAVTTESYQHRGWHLVCLLCHRTLPRTEYHTHIFSREHVVRFLESFHPGSLSSHSENKEILLDLAKQAARIHPMSSEQEILLEQPIWEPCSYERLIRILASAKKRNEDSPIPLEPPVTVKKKLVPRDKIKEVPKNQVKESVTKGMNQKCPENTETASENISVESVAAESDPKAEVSLETCLLVKETSTEEPTKLTVVNQSEDISERENMSQYTETEIVQNQRKNHRKRHISQCEESKDTCPIEAVGGVMNRKKQRLILNQETEDMSDDGKDGAVAAKKGKQTQQFLSKLDCSVVGSNVLYECWCVNRDPIYLCECCSLKVKEEDIISHITDSTHQKMSPLAVDLDEDVYNSLLNQNFKTSLQILRAYLGQQEDGSELPSTSSVQPVATSVTAECQHEMNLSTDNQQVVDMEVEDSVELFSSATAGITVMTNASAFSQGGLDCPVQLGVQMSVTQDITVDKMDPTPSSCFSATSSSTVENFCSSETVRSTLVTSSCIPTNIKCNGTAFKSPAAASCATGDLITSTTVVTDSTFTSAPSKPMGEVSSSSANKSNTTKSSPNQLDVRAKAGPKVTSTTYKSASISVAESADVCEDPFKTTASYRDLSETASTTTVVIQTEVVSSAPTSKSQPENTEAMDERVYMKNSVSTNNIIAPNVSKSDPSAALTTPVFVTSQHKTPPTEPSLTQDRKTKSYKGPCPIGVDQLIKVNCEDKRQAYCQLCMVRLTHSSHTCSFQHQYKYVKLMYPSWTPKESTLEEELYQKVAELAEAEKPLKRTKVNLDVYQELAALPEAIAVQRLVEMVNQKNSRNSPSSTYPGKNTRQPVFSASPSGFTSPDFEMDSPPYEIAVLSTHNQTEKENKNELKTVPVQKAELRVESPSTTLDPLNTSVVSVRPPIQTPDTGEKTFVYGKQQESNVPVLQDAQVSTAGSKETPSSKSVSSDALVRPSTLRQKAEHVPRLSRYSPGQQEAFEAQDTIRMEMAPGPSNLSRGLSVKVTEPFIGLGSIWECREISNKPSPTIYLCECCEERHSNGDIIKHMISIRHQVKYMQMQPQYQKFLYWLSDKDLEEHQRVELVKDIVSFLRERETSMDAQSVLLHSRAYNYVRDVPCIKVALKLVREIQGSGKLNMPIRPAVDLPSQNASALTASQMSPVYPGPTHQGKRQSRNASLSQIHIQQPPQQVTTLSFVQNNTITETSTDWLIPAVQPEQVLSWTDATQPVIASNTVYAAPSTTPFSQNYNPACHVPNQYIVFFGQSNSNTQPTAPAVQASTHPGSFHSQQ